MTTPNCSQLQADRSEHTCGTEAQQSAAGFEPRACLRQCCSNQLSYFLLLKVVLSKIRSRSLSTTAYLDEHVFHNSSSERKFTDVERTFLRLNEVASMIRKDAHYIWGSCDMYMYVRQLHYTITVHVYNSLCLLSQLHHCFVLFATEQVEEHWLIAVLYLLPTLHEKLLYATIQQHKA